MTATSLHSAEDHYKRGTELLERGRCAAAFEHLSRAYLSDPQNARYRSFYALALALGKGQFLGAAELARAAVRQECESVDLYLNLARIYQAFEFKAAAIRVLRRGLMIAPRDPRLERKLLEFGTRRRSPIQFLPRDHLVNRLLGIARSRMFGAVFSGPERLSRA
jgi:predicted Zn-dependent protease